MREKKELEIVQHTTMTYLEILLLEMIQRQPHGHEDLEIGILLTGTLRLFLDQEIHILQKGDIYILNRYQIHSFSQTDEPNQILAFQLDSDFYRRLDPALGLIQFENAIIHSGSLHDQLSDKLLSCALCYFNQQEHYQLRCGSLMLEILHSILLGTRCHTTSEKESMMARSNSLRLNRITDYIGLHYAQRLSLKDLAELEGITEFHLSHFIRKMLGISFQEYLNNVRFEHALQLVRQTDFNILDICLETGFSSSRYLNRMFEKRLGFTVREYRKLTVKPMITAPSLPVGNEQRRFDTMRAREILLTVSR